MADAYRENMKRDDLVFMTKENESEIQKEMSQRRARCAHEWETIDIPAVGSHKAESRTVCTVCFVEKKDWEAALASAIETLEQPNLELPCAP